MKRIVSIAVLAVVIALPFAETTDAGRVRVVHKGPRGRTRVTVRTGFPIHRPLPNVVVRPAPVVRVTPRVYLGPVAFGAVVVASIPTGVTWTGSEELDREDGWTDFTMNIDRRGDRMFLIVDRGAAEISFAEIVFDNGDAQVVDFDDRTVGKGTYSLIDFKDGRKVDHVRVVAKAQTKETELTVRLTS